MLNFKDYFEKKRIDEETHQKAILEEKKRKELEQETKDAGWDSFDSNPKLVDQYIEYITRKSK